MKHRGQYDNTPGFKRTPDYILEAQAQHIIGDELKSKKHRKRNKKKLDKEPDQQYTGAVEEPLDPVVAELEKDCWVEFVNKLSLRDSTDKEIKSSNEWSR